MGVTNLKNRIQVLLIIALLVAAAGTVQASGRVVVYTPIAEELINILMPMFEEQTGISVEVITAGSGELVKRVQIEQHNPYCDVFWGGSNPRGCTAHRPFV